MTHMALEPTKHLFTVTEFEQIWAAGVFDPDARLELLAGEIIEMTAINFPHTRCVTNLNRSLILALGERVVSSMQSPINLSDISQPEPDLMLIDATTWDRLRAHATPPDIALLVEVSDTTLGFDRLRKLPLYARAGVAEVWIVDVNGRAVEVYREPVGDAYESFDRRSIGEMLDVAALPGPTLAVDAIFA